MSRPTAPRQTDFVIPTVLTFVAGFAAVFLGVPYVLMQVRLPFLYQPDSTHLAVFGFVIELPHNIPSLVLVIFYFLTTLIISSAYTMLLVSAWIRFCNWSNTVRDEASEEQETSQQDTSHGEARNCKENLTEKQAPVIDSETLKMPDSKVLHGDPNSL